MTRRASDLPGPETDGPPIWGARNARRDLPSEGEVFAAVLLILVMTLILIGSVLSWGGSA